MDYDDNDFQGHNLHLAGEGSSKISPVLRPYALPKFDFDDGLQAHLRFDSLVENEVFLGIPSQEDNHWIEDFSRGNSGIEFTSSAAESCISRHHNVWFEATSSESVEMLLKSVGQEEMVPGETIIEESGGADELDGLTTQMEPDLKAGDRMIDDINSHPVIAPDERLENFSGINGGSGGEQPHVNSPLQTHVPEISAHASSSELVQDIVSNKCSGLNTEGNLGTFKKCEDGFQKEVDASGNEQMVPGEAIIEESDTADELGGLTTQMEPDLKAGDRMIDDIDSHPVIAPDERLDNYSGINEGSGGEQPHVDCPPQTHVPEISAYASSSELVQDAVSQKCSGLNTEGNLGMLKQCEDGFQKEVDASGNEHLEEKKPEDSSVCGMQVDDIDSFSQNVSAKVELLKDQQLSHTASNICLVEKEHVTFNENASTDDKKSKGNAVEVCDSALCVAQKVEFLEDHAHISDLEEPSHLQTAEECNEVVQKSLCNVQSCEPVSSRGIKTDQHFKDDMHDNRSVVFEGDSFEGNVAEVSKKKNYAYASTGLEVGSLVQAADDGVDSIVVEENLTGANVQNDDVASVSNPERSLLSEVDCESSKQGDGSIINHVVALVSLTASQTSAEWCAEKSEIVKGFDDASGVNNKNSDTQDHVSPSRLAGSLQISEVVLSDSYKTGEDVSLYEKGCEVLLTDSSHFERENVIPIGIDKKTRPDEEVKESKVDTNTGDKLALNLSKEGTTGIVMACGSDLDVTIEYQSDQGYTRLDKMEDKKVDVPMEASLAVLVPSSQVNEEPVLVSEAEKGASQDLALLILPRPFDEPLPMVDTCNIATPSAQGIAEKEVNSQDYSDKLETSPVHCDSMVKDKNYGEADALVGHEKVTMVNCCAVDPVNDAVNSSSKDEKKVESTSAFDMGLKHQEGIEGIVGSEIDARGKTSFEITADNSNNPRKSEGDGNYTLEGGIGSAEPGSPIIISSTEPLPHRKEKEEGIKDAVVEHFPIANVSDRDGDKVHSISLDNSGNGANKEDRSFTFEVSPLTSLSGEEAGKAWQRFPTIKSCKTYTVVEGFPPTSSGGQTDSMMVPAISPQSTQSTDVGMAHGSAKNTAERKTRRMSGKSTGKESARKGSHVKETSLMRRSERGDKSQSMIISPPGVSQPGQFQELKVYGNVEGVGNKPTSVISTSTSNLPDLNSSALPPVLFQQPFTDLQQVQLRAQIFVYGSLIQGAAPDEACMISAFGSSDGGRIIWEPAWRTCLERLHGQKSHMNNIETPKQSRTVGKASDQATMQGPVQNNVYPPPSSRANSKGTPSPVVNPMIPLSSPLWSISTPGGDGLQPSIMRGTVLDYQTLSPLNPYQNTSLRNNVGHTTSWLSQAPFPGPWVAASQASAFDVNPRFPISPVTETVKLTPVRESSLPSSSSSMHASISTVQSGVPGLLAGTSPQLDTKKVMVSPGQQSGETRIRKRKKAVATEGPGLVPLVAPTHTRSTADAVVSNHISKKVSVTEDIGRASLLAQATTESVSAPIVAPVMSGHLSTPVTPVCFTHKSSDGKLLTDVSPTSFIDHAKRRDMNAEKTNGLPEESLNILGEAKLQAEDAAAHAAFAIGHCQGLWSELDKQKNSGLVSDVEARLASAAVAISAAASVAKAAAAAAKVASLAAAQAKIMADEALVPSGTGNLVTNNFGKATPASILKVGDGSNASSSIIVAAKEAARRKVEAASAASRYAENIDAIVKAAELAAEAVSQAGKIVAMGDPLPLSELVEAGPEGHWKISQKPSKQGLKFSSANVSHSKYNGLGEGFNSSAKQLKEGTAIEAQTVSNDAPFGTGAISKNPTDDHLRVLDGEKDSRGQRGHEATGSAKTIGVVPESEIGSGSSLNVLSEYDSASWMVNETGIKENSRVEVFKDTGNIKSAWFSANVLSLKDRKAYVCYTALKSDEGAGKPKEWVSVEGEGNKEPRIRIPHPMTDVRFDGTRKRRRGVLRDYTWSVRDKVDAWSHDCWREGIITEKNKKDETTVTVHFPAEGETAVVRVWDLRPTLIWNNGEWIEWSGSREERVSQGDTPQEKRLKLGNPATEGKGKDKMSKNTDLLDSGKQEESRLLPLSASEKVFNVGKNSRDNNSSDALRTTRIGLQKESRVIFGVPKPGKKRKFMEVSKHYDGDRSSKNDPADDSAKFAKYLMPQVPGPRSWRNSSKVDAKEKQAAESKTKVIRTGKLQNVSGRTLSHKDNISVTAVSASNDALVKEHIKKDYVSNDENQSGQLNLMTSGSVSNVDRTAEGTFLFSSLAVPRDVFSKKVSTSDTRSDQANKGKLAPAGGMLSKVEVQDKSGPEIVGPRRSNRRIQPTSRLLEGLQSSFISKIPSVSHDRSHKSQNRGSKGNNNG